MMTRAALSFLVAVCLFATVGCGSDDSASPTGPGASAPPQEMVATWTFESITFNGTPVPLATAFDWHPSTVSATVRVNADRSITTEELDISGVVVVTTTGTMSVNGHTFTMTETMRNGTPLTPAEVTTATWAIVGNQMTATILEDSDVIVAVLSKPTAPLTGERAPADPTIQ